MTALGTTLRNAFRELLRGQLLLHLKWDRYFVHVIYTFALLAMIIWISLIFDNSMAKVESNKKTLEELSIIHSQKTYEVVTLSRRSTVDAMLKGMGSSVTEPTVPATTLKK